MNKKTKFAYSALFIGLFGIAQAQQFNIIVKQENNYDIVESLEPVISEWVNTGETFNCFDTLDPNDYYNGMTFTQVEECSQKQTQTTTNAEIVNGERKETITKEEKTIVIHNEYDESGLFIARSCNDILNSHGNIGDGLYSITTDNSQRNVFCDMTTDGGGWTIVADQNLYIDGYPTSTSGIPNNDPNDIKNTRLTRWPAYTEYSIKSVIDLHGATYDDSLVPYFAKYTTGRFGEVEVDMIGFYLNKNDYQSGRAKNEYVSFNGVPWGEAFSGDPYHNSYRWFDTNTTMYNYWGQSEIWGHLITTNIFRIASTVTGYGRPGSCGTGWANNSCRLAKSVWLNRNTIKQKAIFMVR